MMPKTVFPPEKENRKTEETNILSCLPIFSERTFCVFVFPDEHFIDNPCPVVEKAYPSTFGERTFSVFAFLPRRTLY